MHALDARMTERSAATPFSISTYMVGRDLLSACPDIMYRREHRFVVQPCGSRPF